MASAATIAKRTARHKASLARAAESFVATPEDLAYDLCGYPYSDIPQLPDGARVLEPSAGDNAIVREILEQNRDVHVTAVEPNAERGAEGRPEVKDGWGYPTAYKVDYVPMTFEAFAATNPDPFDAVVMNPPFVLVDQANVWIGHVRLAWSLLRPGGRLVSVVPNSFKYRAQLPFKELRELVGAHGDVKALPADTFKDAGTGTQTMVIWMVKPLPARPDGLPLWLLSPAAGEPVPVGRWPRVTGEGATTAPVQMYEDGADGYRPRVVRFAGTCHGCQRLLWAHDDGDEPPLQWAACSTLDAETFGQVGPSVGLCLECGNDGDRYNVAHAAAAPYWTDAPADAEPDGPIVYPLDLDDGAWATVTGVDYRGWGFTFTGRVMRTPERVTHDGDEMIAVKLRTSRGVDVELFTQEGRHVTTHDAPASLVPARDRARVAIESASADVDASRGELREAFASCDTATIDKAKAARDDATVRLADVLAEHLPAAAKAEPAPAVRNMRRASERTPATYGQQETLFSLVDA